MGSITFTSGYSYSVSGYFKILVEYETVPDVVLNRSLVRIAKVGFTTTGSSLGTTRTKGWIKIGGKLAAQWEYFEGNSQTACQIIQGQYGYIQNDGAYHGYEVAIDHNEDGSAAVDVQIYFALKSTYNQSILTEQVLTQAEDLPAILRASVVSAADTVLGRGTQITVGRYLEGVSERISWQCGGAGGIIAEANTADRLAWVPELAIAEQVPQAVEAVVTITARTFLGDTDLGSRSCAVRCALPESMVPTVRLSLEDAAGHLAVCGGYVQNQSRVRVRSEAAGCCGSRITGYSVTVGKLTASGADVTMALPDPGMVSVRCVVTDSRGRAAEASEEIPVLAYENPRIAIVSLGRCGADGTADPQGAYGKAVWQAVVTQIPGSTAVYTGIRKEHGGEKVMEAETSGGVFFFPAGIDGAYDISVRAADRFTSTVSVPWLLPVAFLMMDFDRSRRAVGIGMRANAPEAVSLGLDIRMNEHSITGLRNITIGVTELTEDKLIALLGLLGKE